MDAIYRRCWRPYHKACPTKRSSTSATVERASELRDIPLAKTYLGSLTYHESQALERYAPEHLELENGVKRRLTYTLDHGPVLSCRFEWLFE